jgi:hypothetical protein
MSPSIFVSLALNPALDCRVIDVSTLRLGVLTDVTMRCFVLWIGFRSMESRLLLPPRGVTVEKDLLRLSNFLGSEGFAPGASEASVVSLVGVMDCLMVFVCLRVSNRGVMGFWATDFLIFAVAGLLGIR